MYWGLASLILIIGVAGVYFMLQPDPDMEPEKKFIAPSEVDLEQAREARKPPREAKDGFTWEWHADHWHEVPMAQNETPSGHPVQENQSEKPEFTGPLTYHKELLESNPVEALRLQTEERGIGVLNGYHHFHPTTTKPQQLHATFIISFITKVLATQPTPNPKMQTEELLCGCTHISIGEKR